MKPINYIGYSDYSDFDAPEEPVVMRRIRIRALPPYKWEIHTVDENGKDYGDPLICGHEDIVYWIDGLDDEDDVQRAAKHGEVGSMNQETFDEMVYWLNDDEEEVFTDSRKRLI